MNRSWWSLVETTAGFLDADEQDAVLGDVLESEDSGPRAFFGMLGLVARRQVVLWQNWRPWAVFVAVILPLGFLLSMVSRWTSDGSAIYIWMYANNWDWALTRNPGFWRLLGETSLSLSLTFVMLGCWAWVAGFILGFLSRGMERINGLLLVLILLIGELGAPRYFDYVFEYERRAFGLNRPLDGNAVVFAVAFYQVVFPLIVQMVLVVLPALWGMSWARAGLKRGRFLRLALVIAAVTTLMGLLTHELSFWALVVPRVTRLYPHPAFWNPILHAWQLLEPIQYWPLLFLLAHVIKKRRPTTAVV